ncbi:hypothetical protein [Pleionea litopenaei]|uniref:Uncharacterized protein n=1 Tax=Pleionea litopenaei TaxID=3070815 RepID=A0AA51RWK1_9GAMM|nr:hypothetical protein [Pleionea sp. HL-JVS1]WMS88835.1 hypothetical protein Q9312_07925 [Pleionea sp. HL-JVS1]
MWQLQLRNKPLCINMKSSETEYTEFEVPVTLKVSLILVVASLSSVALVNGMESRYLATVAFALGKNVLFIPGVFVLFGIVLKLRDREFKLSNAYYLGLLMSVVLSVKSLSAV